MFFKGLQVSPYWRRNARYGSKVKKQAPATKRKGVPGRRGSNTPIIPMTVHTEPTTILAVFLICLNISNYPNC
ncbi:hypothetical protein CAL7102_03637 [Dulcicalothrix desertica PCC 7102]|nr:hypothetical protein CAL7102_03637 [Dulcicalothrix desertica PCC 7102]